MLPPCLVCRVLFPASMKESMQTAFQMDDFLSFQPLVLEHIQMSFQYILQDNTIQKYILNSLQALHCGIQKATLKWE